MPRRPSSSRRFRKRVSRRFYAGLYRVYRAVFPTPSWTASSRPASLQRILVVQHYGVGDMVLTTPLLAFLKEHLPGAEIDVLASPRNAAVIAGDDRVANVFVHDHTWRRWLSVLPRLRARRYDAILCGQAGKGLAEGLTASLAAHPHTYKFSVWRPKRYHGLFTTVVRVPRSVTHIADRLLYVAHAVLGDEPPRPTVERYPLRIASDEKAAATAARFVAAYRVGPYVLVNVSAHLAARDWAPEHCARFVTLLLERHPDVTVVLSRAPGKAWQAEKVAALSASPRVVVAPAMPLLAVAALAQAAVAVITTETALIHIAAACGRPVVALYAPETPSEVAHWLPVGVPYRALVSRPRRGMTDIPAADVADALDAVLRQARTSRDVAAVPAAQELRP